jgi:GAF domain-containing protein
VRSALCVPLIERGELLGVLNLSAPSEGDFSEYDLRAVSLFAEQAATAIGKARLYERSQQQAEELARAASSDALTGLANRAALDTRMAATAGSEPLLFLDLDGFKEVNDELGHAAGDEVWSRWRAPARLRRRCRPGRPLRRRRVRDPARRLARRGGRLRRRGAVLAGPPAADQRARPARRDRREHRDRAARRRA